jgi:bifunctional DNA-binding transcriptional regulator/antitoxin component of YhaV-PrlF toxin-antitoxin module
MEKYFVTVGQEGEVEIPVALRESLGIVEGTRARFQLDGVRIILEFKTRPPIEVDVPI